MAVNVVACCNHALRLPASLMDDLRMAAEREKVSVDGFIIQAAADKVVAQHPRGLLEKLSPAEQSAYLKARAARAQPGRMADILAKAGTAGLALPGDEVPDGWI